MPLLRYLIILALVYVLYRLVKASLRDFFMNLNAKHRHTKDGNQNVHSGRNANLDDIEDAKYEEIKDDTEERKN